MSDQRPDPFKPDVSAEHPVSENWIWTGSHRPAMPRALIDGLARDWELAALTDDVHPAAAYSADRRRRLAEQFPGATLVVPTGNFKVRSNDTDYDFRPGSDFYYLTGSVEPDCVLVITPGDAGERAVLYVAHRRDQRTHEFISDARYGELWVGARRGVDEAARYYGVQTVALDQMAGDLAVLGGDVLTLRGLDPSVDVLRGAHEGDGQLAATLGEMRLTKDAFEVAALQKAIDDTVKGFVDVVRALPEAIGRGQRVVEGVFNLRARVEGNDVGYGTIAASGPNATTLHWMRNDGAVRAGDLLLLDAGVEGHYLYTADVTRTMPVSGQFTPPQRRIYDIVLAAQEAGLAAVAPGAPFEAAHNAAVRVMAEGLYDLGILADEPEVSVRPDRQTHRRYTLHGVSHMLGLDVHDCDEARREVARGELRPGYVLTVEPGIYFQPNDLTVPEEYRGIGVRIEDDVLVTTDGSRNLSAALPRAADDVEAWMDEIWSRQGASDLGLTD